jgi:glutamate-1-semialdehyde 2,1-aminomutase
VTKTLFLFDEYTYKRKGFCFSSEMLARGVYVHPWHNMFLCAAMTEADIEAFLAAAEGALDALKRQSATLQPVPKLAFLTAGGAR